MIDSNEKEEKNDCNTLKTFNKIAKTNIFPVLCQDSNKKTK